MGNIFIEKLYDFYIDTLTNCGTSLLDQDDETVEYIIFEEFDIGAHSFLHIDSLKRLYEAELINEEELNTGAQIHDKVINLQNNDEWDLECFRTSEKWKELLKLCDYIKTLR